MFDARVQWPSPTRMRRYCELISAYEPGLQNVFGFIDGVYVPCNEPTDRDEQNAYYNAWRGCCSLTNVLVFGPDGCIIWANCNAPGSWHDSKVAISLYHKLLDAELSPPEYVLVADSAFPTSGLMKNRIITPPKVKKVYEENMAIIERNGVQRLEEKDPNADSLEAVIRARQAVEWGMHSLQSVFRRLHVRFVFDPPYTQHMLKLVFHLYNLRTRRMGLCQIRTVYMGPLNCLQRGTGFSSDQVLS